MAFAFGFIEAEVNQDGIYYEYCWCHSCI